MREIGFMIQRELSFYLRSPLGFIVMAAVLVIDGLLFNAWAIGDGQRRSSEVLEIFFYCKSGTTLLASIFIAMRLIAEERQEGTLVLLTTSPLKDYHIVLGKFFAALIFLVMLNVLTFTMPALVAWHGKVSLGHMAAGYLGLLLLGGASLAIGLFASAFSPNQLVAAILGAALITVFVLLWLLSRIASPPIETMLSYLSLHDKHFRPFMRGIVSLQDVVFYISLTYVALVAATRVLEARRWR